MFELSATFGPFVVPVTINPFETDPHLDDPFELDLVSETVRSTGPSFVPLVDPFKPSDLFGDPFTLFELAPSVRSTLVKDLCDISSWPLPVKNSPSFPLGEIRAAV